MMMMVMVMMMMMVRVSIVWDRIDRDVNYHVSDVGIKK